MEKSRYNIALLLHLKENRLLQFNYGAKLRKIVEIAKYLGMFLCPGQKFLNLPNVPKICPSMADSYITINQ